MGALQLTQQPSGCNGNGANGKAPLACPRGKKPFGSREEAEQFEAENRKRFPNQGTQYAYECPDCPAFHLTSKPPEAYAMGQSNLKRLEALATDDSVKASAKQRPRGETEASVRRLWEHGMSDSSIASQLGITPAAVAYHRKKFASENNKTVSVSSRQLKSPLTLSELEERKLKLEREYQAELLRIEEQKQRLAQASKLTVCECQDGKALFIKFGHDERMSVPKDKVQELTNCLMDWV
jgi:predicted transcriptional regulator